jgi:hypothetical protein
MKITYFINLVKGRFLFSFLPYFLCKNAGLLAEDGVFGFARTSA